MTSVMQNFERLLFQHNQVVYNYMTALYNEGILSSDPPLWFGDIPVDGFFEEQLEFSIFALNLIQSFLDLTQDSDTKQELENIQRVWREKQNVLLDAHNKKWRPLPVEETIASFRFINPEEVKELVFN